MYLGMVTDFSESSYNVPLIETPRPSQMTTIKYPTPLSPPSSPHMSGAAHKKDEYPWPISSGNEHGQIYATATYGVTPAATVRSTASAGRSPLMQSGTFGFPHLGKSPSLGHQINEKPSDANTVPKASMISSPSTRRTPHASITEARGFAYGEDEDEDVELDDVEHDGNDEGDDGIAGEASSRVLTAAEIRARKRKMKRFRLTHQQTRYLMSEFARQAHPDAAHREQLSREIPGLSPRQVQVWFQNRRAKLKRLTADDRMRTMQSRALPTDFDNSSALHGTFTGQSAPFVAPTITTPSAYGIQVAGAMRSYVDNDDCRRASAVEMHGEGNSAMTTVGNDYSQIARPQFVLPSSGGSEYHSLPVEAYRRQSFPAHLSSSSSSAAAAAASYVGYPHASRPAAPERYARTTVEDVSSPLRRGLSYSDASNDSPLTRAVSYPEKGIATAEKEYHEPREYYSAQTEPSVYDPGFNYPGVQSYAPNDYPHIINSLAARPPTGFTAGQHYVYGPRTEGGPLAEQTQETFHPYPPQYGIASSFAVFPGSYDEAEHQRMQTTTSEANSYREARQ